MKKDYNKTNLVIARQSAIPLRWHSVKLVERKFPFAGEGVDSPRRTKCDGRRRGSGKQVEHFFIRINL